MGRPTKIGAKIAGRICERIAGGESLRTICAGDGMPAKSTVLRRLAVDETFRAQYARARETQMDALAEEILEIADTPQEGVRVEEGSDKDGAYEKTIRDDMLGHRRLQVDARKWLMGKLAPKKYGDKLEHSGSIGVRHEDALEALK